MSVEEAVSKSPLDKPLHLLTEDDISQLTREDCRRYLKEKGMRRPSWNKSQAIQQVISLKALLETPPDSDAGTRKKLYIPRSDNHPRTVPRRTSDGTEFPVSADESVPYRPKEPENPILSGDLPARLVYADNDSAPPRDTGITDGPAGQMTIFYCGKVNVYDDVPVDKARAIMQLASTPFLLNREAPCIGNSAGQPLRFHLQMPCLQTGKIDNPRLQGEDRNMYDEDIPGGEGQTSRKASVQRYLEKRKDRFKGKKRVGAPLSSSLNIYLNHQMAQTPTEQSSRSETCSPPPPNTPSDKDVQQE